MDTTLSIGERLRILRLRRGLDQIDVANAVGVSRAQIGKWERGASTPDLNTKIRLCRFFVQPLDTFCSEDDLVDLRSALEVGIRGVGSGTDQGEPQSGWTKGPRSFDPSEAAHEGPRSTSVQELCTV